jgi:hypothetical protein
LKIQKSIRTPLPKWEFSWECGVHSLPHSHTPRSMKCDSRASLLACTFASRYLGRELKVRIATKKKIIWW